MMTVFLLIKRNVRLFFKDIGMLLTSLITPLILLVLYATFLADIYRNSFLGMLGGVSLPEEVINGLVGGQLMSSLLAVSCVTVAFCSNMLMVQDKVTGARRDLLMTPVRRSSLALGYYVATLGVTLIIALVAMGASLLYIACIGFYLSLGDVLLLLLDVLLLVMLGTALSSIVNYFLSTQGQISAVGSIVSSCYGFISGAYMPISGFSDGLRDVISFLPGTYATALMRNHAMAGAFRKMAELGVPDAALDAMRDSVDCNIYFFGTAVAPWVMYLVLGGAALLCLFVFILIQRFDRRRN